MIYKVSFEWIKEMCQFRKDGFNEEVGGTVDTCRSEHNKPKGCSWGECREDICPLLKVSRRAK